MMPRKNKPKSGKEAMADYRHDEAKRKNNPPAKIAAEGAVPLMSKIEYEYSPRLPPVLRFDPTGAPDKLPELLEQARERKLTENELRLLAEALRKDEPWLEWAGKRELPSFAVDPVALHIHERVSAQAILRVAAREDVQRDLFADPQQQYHEAVQFYQHDVDWANRLILGDSLLVMASLAKREDLAGKVQMIYIDPPYGIRFGSNFQSEIGRRDVKEKEKDLTREAEVIKAYRDTWKLGIHSYLSYLRDRLIISRELLSDTGSVFVQISDENVHRVRELLDEVFGRDSQVVTIVYKKKGNQKGGSLDPINDYILWYARNKAQLRVTELFLSKFGSDEVPDDFDRLEFNTGELRSPTADDWEKIDSLIQSGVDLVYSDQLTSGGEFRTQLYEIIFQGRSFKPAPNNSWKHNEVDMTRVLKAERAMVGKTQIRFKKKLSDFGSVSLTNVWADLGGAKEKRYVVQTNARAIERCMLMTTHPGDLVLDPTCGGGTTPYVAEQWARRWIAIDTSRVATAITRQRLLTSKFDLFKLRELTESDRNKNPNGFWLRDSSKVIADKCTFKCNEVPHITLKSIAQNDNLDPIFFKHDLILDEKLATANVALGTVTSDLRRKLVDKLAAKQRAEGKKLITDADRRRWELRNEWEHWQVPFDTDPDWPEELVDSVNAYRQAWRAKMDEVNACIEANADQEELVDHPLKVSGVVRVSGPFTVEAVQPPEMSLSEPSIIEFGGAPDSLDETFDGSEGTPPPVKLSFVEPVGDLEVRNVEAYIDQMIRLLRTDGVRFPNNKEIRFTRLERIIGTDSGLHAEGRWTPKGTEDHDSDGRASVCVGFGPQYGPVTAKQVEDLVRSANRRGYDDLVIAGFSFDGPAQAVIEEAQHPKLRVHMANIRPDVNPGMAGLLKEQPGSQLFTVFGQPRTLVAGPDAGTIK
ncbi:MAG: site-specific DNA-methyltransferase [Acidobacteriota bacterium]|nr:site-specific DNA-methyltransferase [Acidobacteriota bacterium]